MNIFLISTLSQVVKCRFLTRSRFFFLASFSSLSFWFKNLILKKVLVRTYFRTTSPGTDLNRAWICLTVVSITWYWALRPFFPWMSLKTSSNCRTWFRKWSEGSVSPPRESALIHGELFCAGLETSFVLQPSSGYFRRNLWAKKPAKYFRPSWEQSKLWEESRFSDPLLDSAMASRSELLTSSAEKLGSSYSLSSAIERRIWNSWIIL